ncbi:D-alanyl-D-alanine carboxypeptidase family protein [Anaeromicropila herbilytica]|uniref:D-alanyl-D-alanine carboxypeptidase n=1 Tax=Anaeromicropila herbilytica TaxID=2785025 RepID=A0A7R7EQ57_9FIRM|nr:D-alanyl-D-alanine carboxypeptidase family protein [Anaeromicropila herbilytica]BCN33009.1 D-alanyl-D-alanine carboxypeptidase [Anaeromicropila herbilytica]
MKRIVTILLISLLVFSDSHTVYAAKARKDNPSNTVWPKGPSVTSDAAIIMDANTGLILYEKNIHKRFYPASITKILTTLLAIENCSLNEIVTFSRTAIFGIERDSSHIGIDVGEKLTVEQCLYGIMLESANEVAYGIAEHVAGNMKSFADLMNQKAKELGCKDSHFVNSNGLHNDKHYTSAYDMALISKAAISNSTFRKVTSTVSYVIPPTNIQKESRYLTNHHKMLRSTCYHYDGCIGGKTGYTTISKNTLVTFAKKGDLELICVVMHSDPVHQYTDTAELLDFGFNNYTAYNLSEQTGTALSDNTPFFTRYNTLFDKQNTPLQTSTKGIVVLPNSANIKDVTKSINYSNKTGDSKDNTVIGSITYTYKGKTVGTSDITYDSTKTKTLLIDQNQNKTTNKYDTLDANKHLKLFIIICISSIVCLSFIAYYILVVRARRRNSAYFRKSRTSNRYY